MTNIEKLAMVGKAANWLVSVCALVLQGIMGVMMMVLGAVMAAITFLVGASYLLVIGGIVVVVLMFLH
jgi:hypothetical protein